MQRRDLRPEPVAGEHPGAAPSFEDFYRAEQRWAARLAFVITADAELAADLAHDAFAAMHDRFPELDEPRAYLRVTLVRMAVRRRTRDRRIRAAERVAPPSPVGAASTELLDLVDRLPARQRAVLVLRYYEDLTEAEIATALRCRPGTVKSLASRALANLRKALG